MFPIVDITHKPKRHQSQVKDEISTTNGSMTVNEKSDIINMYKDSIPTGFITLEKAIKFYETNSEVDLFKITAEWLNELRAIRKQAIEAQRKQVKAEVIEDDSTEEDET